MPGYDRTGPRGEGPLTGGRRGLCVSPELRGRGGAPGFGVGRGGAPYGGGRGRAWGGGYGQGYGYYRMPPDRPADYPAPIDESAPGFAGAIVRILDRLSELGAAVSALHDKFQSSPSQGDGPEEQ